MSWNQKQRDNGDRVLRELPKKAAQAAAREKRLKENERLDRKQGRN